jgi:hypothetical protein
MTDADSEPVVLSHAAERLAKAIVLATESPADPRTLMLWGQCVGVSRGALRVWCASAGVSARSCLDFLRILRAVIRAQGGAWDLFSTLDVVDPRSLTRLLARGGVRELARTATPPSIAAFLASQRFLPSRSIVQAVARHLSAAKEPSVR